MQPPVETVGFLQFKKFLIDAKNIKLTMSIYFNLHCNIYNRFFKTYSSAGRAMVPS